MTTPAFWGGVPGGFAVQLTCYLVMVLAGLVLAGRGSAALRGPGPGR